MLPNKGVDNVTECSLCGTSLLAGPLKLITGFISTFRLIVAFKIAPRTEGASPGASAAKACAEIPGEVGARAGTLDPDKTSSLLDGFSCQTRSNNRQSEAPSQHSWGGHSRFLGHIEAPLVDPRLTFFLDYCFFFVLPEAPPSQQTGIREPM